MSDADLRPLDPPGPPVPARALLDGFDPRSLAGDERPYVFVCMVSTVDGRAALDGRSSALGGPADLAMLLELRTLADAVLIGTGTVRAEGYDRLVRDPERRARRRAAGLAEDPTAVLLSPSGRVPWEAGLFAAAEQPVLVCAGRDGLEVPEVAASVEVLALDDPALAALLGVLRARGVRSMLCEGGPGLNRSLFAAGLVDELFLTVGPVISGDDREPAIVAGPPLGSPAALELRSVSRAGDDLFLRYAVARG
jgi:riboflavin-specific deaminase-like protein